MHFRAENRDTWKCSKALRYRRGLFDFLIPVPVTGIQPDQVLGLKERFPRRRRGAALIPVTSTGMRMRRDCNPP
ncbi:hypothetical protein CN070_14290 [Sinorhizobium meliloti]|nr:hypothetical protein CN070_14290 [Sinorhizobium meliloti]